MRRLKIITSLILIVVFAMQPVFAATVHDIKITLSEKDLKDLNSGDAASVFYHLILANSTLVSDENTDKNTKDLAKLFFSKDLYNVYVREKKMDDNYFNAKGDEGCIDFNPIIGGQDIPYGFYVDPSSDTKSKIATVTVNLKYANNSALLVHLIKTEGYWKITDIDYPNKTSMRTKLQECLNNPKYKRYS